MKVQETYKKHYQNKSISSVKWAHYVTMKVISKHGMMSDDCLEIHGHAILTTFILSKLIPKLNITTSAAIFP